jgi:hypothetical protein
MLPFLQIFLSKFPKYFSPLYVTCSRQLKHTDFVNRLTQEKTVLPFYIRGKTLSCDIASVCINVLPNYRVLRRIFGPKRDEVTGEWKKLRNEGLNDLYCSPNNFRVIKYKRMRWAGHVASMGERRGVYRLLVGKPEGKETNGETQA